ncbi:MAG: glycosyltransferase [Acidobacteriota bacterium]
MASLKISLVVPVKNEVDSIARLLNSIAMQTRPPDEVLIVDGGSTDGTALLIEAWANERKLDDWVRVLRVDEATPGKGRNIGIAAASHEWIALTDAGIRLEATWLERLAHRAEDHPPLAVVYGNYEPVSQTFFERCAALAYVAPKQVRGGYLMRAPSIASVLMRREVWQAVGGFPDLRAAEDLIFMRGIEERGFKTGWVQDATVWWQLQPTLGCTFRKFVSYSRHNVLAGQQRYWHYGVARQYAVWLAAAALALLASKWFWLLPVAGTGARVAKNIWQRRDGRGLWWLLNPAQFALVAAILLTIDLATFTGWAQALLATRREDLSDDSNAPEPQRAKP